MDLISGLRQAAAKKKQEEEAARLAAGQDPEGAAEPGEDAVDASDGKKDE
jgi:hypothetical protein